MLDNFQRITVEDIRRFKGPIQIVGTSSFVWQGERYEFTEPDDEFRRDLALAVQGYFNRKNEKKK